MIHALNDVGIDLSGYRYDEDSKHLFTQRTINGKAYELPFEAESDGTKKMIAALPVLMVALQEGRTVVVDELDAKLHPKLLRYVIQMFKNQELNKKGAQLLFSSHDLTTMKNTVFRRDEIWFAAMNDNHESEIYSGRRTILASRAQRPLTSSIWKADMVQINVCLCLKVLANGKAESLHGCDWLDLCRVGIKEANTICVKCWIE